MSRPSWDVTWLGVATIVSRRSLCSRDQVGAVIVDPRNRIVATGYNGPPQGWTNQLHDTDATCDRWCVRGANGPTDETARSYVDCPSLHAEANALSVCDRSVREDGTLYVTSAICFGCAKLVANSGLSRVVIATTDEIRNSYREPGQSITLLEQSGIHVFQTAR